MNKALLDIIDEIIDSLENESFESFVYDNDKFYIVDKYNNIDFQAKLGNNNYYFRDNISGMSFMKVKKYINDNTSIQQILIQNEKEKCYYSYLERNGYIRLVRALRIEGNDSLVCNNFNVLNQSWKEIAKYADECFEDISNMDDIQATYIGVDVESDEELSEIEDDEYDEEYDDEDDYDYELDQIDENEKYGLSDVFEQNSIQAYQTYILAKEEYESKGEKYNQNKDRLPIGDYSEEIEDYYSSYQLWINKKEITGQAKCRIIADCEAAADENAFDSSMFDQAVINLKSVIEALQKQNIFDKNNGIEK